MGALSPDSFPPFPVAFFQPLLFWDRSVRQYYIASSARLSSPFCFPRRLRPTNVSSPLAVRSPPSTALSNLCDFYLVYPGHQCLTFLIALSFPPFIDACSRLLGDSLLALLLVLAPFLSVPPQRTLQRCVFNRRHCIFLWQMPPCHPGTPSILGPAGLVLSFSGPRNEVSSTLGPSCPDFLDSALPADFLFHDNFFPN